MGYIYPPVNQHHYGTWASRKSEFSHHKKVDLFCKRLPKGTSFPHGGQFTSMKVSSSDGSLS